MISITEHNLRKVEHKFKKTKELENRIISTNSSIISSGLFLCYVMCILCIHMTGRHLLGKDLRGTSDE